MDKTKVLIVTPSSVDCRIKSDLDIRNREPEDKVKFAPDYDALTHYEFYYAGWIDQPREQMIAIVNEIVQLWPDIAYAVYLDPHSQEGIFYHDLEHNRREYVQIDEFMTELDRHGIPSIPMEMYIHDFWDAVTIQYNFRWAVEVLTSIPRVLYRGGKLILPTANIWLIENEREIFRYLSRKPDKVLDMSPREFEKLVASIFRANGFNVELTPASHDGGFDVLAVQRSNLVGETRFLIECKRYKKDKKIGIGLVQRLIGTVNQFKATKGILVTTSSFTRDALNCVKSTGGILTVKDYKCLEGWLKDLDL